MLRHGSLILSDLREPTLTIVCAACGRRGRYNVAGLMERHGDAKLTELLWTLVECRRRVHARLCRGAVVAVHQRTGTQRRGHRDEN
jgi:hypothetical protein